MTAIGLELLRNEPPRVLGIAVLTRVAEVWPARPLRLAGDWPCKVLRILELEPVFQAAAVFSGFQPFDQVLPCARRQAPIVAAAVLEKIARVDDERAAFPAADRAPLSRRLRTASRGRIHVHRSLAVVELPADHDRIAGTSIDFTSGVSMSIGAV